MVWTGLRLNKSFEELKAESRRLTAESRRLRQPHCGQPPRLNNIEDYLRLEAEIARCNFNAAERTFWRVSADISCKDHERQIGEASRAQALTRKALLRALERINRFLVYGTVPPDLYLD
jgi:hypothetical protein